MTLARKYYDTFDFVGVAREFKGKHTDKGYNTASNDSGWKGHGIKMFIDVDDVNSILVEAFGGYFPNNKIRTFEKSMFGSGGGEIEVPWDLRKEQSTIDMVAEFRKFEVNVEEDDDIRGEMTSLYYSMNELARKEVPTDEEVQKYKDKEAKLKELSENRYELITEYDFVDCVYQNLNSLLGHKVRVRGSIKVEEYQGNIYVKYIMESITRVADNFVNRSTARIFPIFNSSSVDSSLVKEDGKVYINGYMENYDNAKKGISLFPQTFVLDTNRFDLTDDADISALSLLIGLFEVGDTYHQQRWEAEIFNGAEVEEVELDEVIEESLTDLQKELLKAGELDVEDVLKDGNRKVFGETIREIRLIKPYIKGEFADGAVSRDLTEEDVLRHEVVSTKDVSKEDVDTGVGNTESKETPSEVKQRKDVLDEIFR